MTAASQPANDPARLLRSWRVVFWGVLVLAFALYISTLSGRPVWDDNQILNGEGIGGGTVLGAITKPFLHGYFRPLVALFLLFENTVFHGNTFYYHVVNVLLHVGSCALLMGLLLECFRSRRIAILGGALFAIHPVLVSTISWIGGITDCLGTLFVLAFAYTLVLSVKAEASKGMLWTGLSALFFLAALFCKEQTIALVLLAPLARFAFVPSSRRPTVGEAIAFAAPFILGAILFLVAWKVYFPGYPDVNWSIAQRVQTIGESISYYALILLVPTGKWLQTYTLGSFASAAWIWALVGFVILGAFLWMWMRAYKKDKVFAWFGAFLLLSILPVVNIIPPPSLVVAPYRAGVAVVGLSAMLAVVFGRKARSTVGYGFLAFISIWWLAMASAAIPPWQDQQSLFTAIVEDDPSFLQARQNLALTLLSLPDDQQANAKEAVANFEAVLDQVYGPDVWRGPDGGVDLFKSDPEVGKKVAANKGPMEGDIWLGQIFVQLGEARVAMGDYRGAQTAFQAALSIRPANFTADVALAQLCMAGGDKASGIHYLEEAAKLKPDDPNVAQMLEAARK